MAQPSAFNGPTDQWTHGAAIADPSGGTTTDAQARTTIISILAALRSVSVISGATALDVSQGWNGPTSQIVQGPAIAAPSGGTTADAELRTAIGSVLAVLQSTGIIAGGSGGPTPVLDPTTNQLAAAGPIADVSGGATIDSQGRTAINSALAAMREASLISH